MILLTLLICAAFAQEPPPRQPLTVLLIPLDTKEPKTLAFQCGMGMYKSSVVIE